MKGKVVLFMAALTLFAACNTGKKTVIKGSFSSAENAPATLNILVGNAVDTLIRVNGDKFEARIPTNKMAFSYIICDDQPLRFVADGSTLTVDFVNKTVISSDENGITSRMNAFDRWETDFRNEFRSKIAGLSEEERQACATEAIETQNAYLRQLIQENSDNVIALMCIDKLNLPTLEEKVELLNTLAPSLKEDPSIAVMIEDYTNLAATAEGKMFRDFTVVQDPEHPDSTTVKLSDYVGKGKYILLYFWASWDRTYLEESLYLKPAYDRFRGDRFDMVGVAISDKPEQSRAAAEQIGFTWDQVVSPGEEPAILYGIQSVPHIVLFGPDGTILKRGIRAQDLMTVLSETLAQ